MKFLNKFKPKNILIFIKSRKRTILFNTSMLFLCVAFCFLILFGMLERDGAYKTNTPKTNPTDSDTENPGSTETPIAPPKDTEEYIITNMGGEPISLNSIMATDMYSKTVLRHMLEGLVRLDREGKPIPAVALSWETSEDNLTWTFELRDTSIWQDGAKVTSNDFKTTIDVHQSDEANSPYKNQMSFISSVTCPDDKTIVFSLTKETPDFLTLLTQSEFMPIQKELYDKYKVIYGKEPENICFNGPWYPTQWKHSQRIILDKNESYWNKDQISLLHLMFIFGGTPVSRLNNFKDGKYDMLFLTAPEIELYEKENIPIRNFSDGNIVYLEFNKSNQFLQDENLRKALSLSINRDGFVSILKNGSTPVTGFAYETDFPEAKKFLETAKAALKNGTSISLTISVDNETIQLTSNKEDAFCPSAVYSEEIARQWRSLGIDVKVESLSYADIVEKTKTNSLCISIKTTKADRNSIEAPLYHKHTAFISNDRIRDVITVADREMDLYYAGAKP